MIMSPTYGSVTPPDTTIVAAPVPRTRTDRGFPPTDRTPRTLTGEAEHEPHTVFKIASRREELYAAFRLVYEAYLRSGLTPPNPYGIRVTPYQLLPTTEIFVAKSRSEVICTMSLVRDGQLGLPMEAIYDEEVAWRRMQGRCLAEVSCLADKPGALDQSFPVVIELMGLMAQCAKRRGVDELLIAVHPRHARFYGRFAAFQPIGEEKTYGTVCDNPAVAMAVDLNRVHLDYPRVHKRFFGKPYPREALQYRPLSEELRAELRPVADECCPGGANAELELLACA